jgi:hypothetical protein
LAFLDINVIDLLTTTAVSAVIGGMVAYYVSRRVSQEEWNRQENKEHLQKIKDDVLKPMQDHMTTLIAHLEAVVHGRQLVSVEDLHPWKPESRLFEVLPNHFPNLLANWEDVESDTRSRLSQCNQLHEDMFQFFTSNIAIPVVEQFSSEKTTFATREILDQVYKFFMERRAPSVIETEFQSRPSQYPRAMPGSLDLYKGGFTYAVGSKQQIDACKKILREIMLSKEYADSRDGLEGQLGPYRKAPKISVRFDRAQVQNRMRGKCDVCRGTVLIE